MNLNKDDFKLAGYFGVDAGICWIGDPCYILHKDQESPKEIGEDWQEFCRILSKKRENQSYANFNYDLGHEGLGICVDTGWGDGSYPVYIKEENGRCMGVFIDFNNEWDEDESSSE